jgi:predicted GNAT family N-acyltransferase
MPWRDEGGVEVQLLDWSTAQAAARPVREEVFVREQGVPPALEYDDLDPVSDHAVARDPAGRAIGTGRLLPDGRIGRMAVLADARGQGVGAAILAALMERARARGMNDVLLFAQCHAVPFYARFGFVAEGETYLEAGIPHVKMRQRLAALPGAS